MGIFDGFLLMSDFDGTLASRAVVSDENRDAIRYFQNEGGLFSLASGRFPSWIGECSRFFTPDAPNVMLNGTAIVSSDGRTTIKTSPLDREATENVSREIMSECPRLDHVRIHTESEHIAFRRGEDLDFTILHGDLLKILYYSPAECSEEYAEKIRRIAGSRYLITRSWENGIELQNAGSDKGDGLKYVKKTLGERARITVGAGDYENDLSLILAADIGYAPADAIPKVLRVADRVTVPHTESAIAHIIEELEKQNRRGAL